MRRKNSRRRRRRLEVLAVKAWGKRPDDYCELFVNTCNGSKTKATKQNDATSSSNSNSNLDSLMVNKSYRHFNNTRQQLNRRLALHLRDTKSTARQTMHPNKREVFRFNYARILAFTLAFHFLSCSSLLALKNEQTQQTPTSRNSLANNKPNTTAKIHTNQAIKPTSDAGFIQCIANQSRHCSDFELSGGRNSNTAPKQQIAKQQQQQESHRLISNSNVESQVESPPGSMLLEGRPGQQSSALPQAGSVLLGAAFIASSASMPAVSAVSPSTTLPSYNAVLNYGASAGSKLLDQKSVSLSRDAQTSDTNSVPTVYGGSANSVGELIKQQQMEDNLQAAESKKKKKKKKSK